MENRPTYTLEELSSETGFDTRVIRNFVEQGLLRGPTSLGRYARYSDRHLVRLLAIKALKEARGLKLSDIRQTLLCMSEPEIVALAETVRAGHTDAPPVSALDYLRSLNMQAFDSQMDQLPASKMSAPLNTTLNELSTSASNLRLDSETATPTSERQLPPIDTWHRFLITPDVELSVRGLQTEQQMTRMKNIASRLRDYLIGGQNE